MKKLVYILLGLLVVCCFSMVLYMVTFHRTMEKLSNAGGKYPILQFELGENVVNYTYAYLGEVDYKNKKTGTITSDDRKIKLNFVNGKLENTKVEIIDQAGKILQNCDMHEIINLNDEVKDNATYYLKVSGNFKDKVCKYVTRLYVGKNLAKEHIKFAEELSNTLLKKGSMEAYAKYFPNINMDDNELLNVDRMSGIKALQYSKANLEVVREKPYEIFVANDFMTSIVKEKLIKDGERYFIDREFFRLRDSGENIFLLDYKRDLNEKFDYKISDKGINLGVTKENNFVINNKDNIAFTKTGELYKYNNEKNSYTPVFRIEEKNEDMFDISSDYFIKPVSIDGDGGIYYAIIGRIPYGEMEGIYGIQYLHYDQNTNNNIVLSGIELNQPTDYIASQVTKFMSADSDGNVIFMISDKIYKFTPSGTVNEELNTNNRQEYVTSEDGVQVAYVQDGEIKVVYTNLDNGRIIKNTYGENTSIHPIAFRANGDFAYYVKDDAKNVITEIVIINSRNEVVKEYKSEYKITGVDVNESTIVIHRFDDKKNSKIEDDFILNVSGEGGEGTKVTNADSNYGATVNLTINRKNDTDLIVENRAKIDENLSNKKTAKLNVEANKYAVYSYGMVNGFFDNMVQGVVKASETNGLLRDKAGKLIWQRELAKNDVLLKGVPFAATDKIDHTAEACIKALEQYYSMKDSYDSHKSMDENIKSIFSNAYKFRKLTIEDLMYFAQNNSPVMVDIGDNEYALLLGLSGGSATFMRPMKGGIEYINMKSLDGIVNNDGYIFLTD